MSDVTQPQKNLKKELEEIITGDVFDDEAAREQYSTDASLFIIKPQLIVAPRDSADVQALVYYVATHPEKKLSLTGRSAGTDMTGGPLTESIVVSFTQYMNRIKAVGEGFAIAEPGVYYRDFEKATLAQGWLLPSYPASRELCALGGMVSNNSGGEKTLTYGKTEDYVQQLKMVLRDGNEYTFHPLNRQQLHEKMAQQDLEGQIYRDIYALVTHNQQLLHEAKPRVSKNSAGYYLWNVWDGQTFDMTKLLVGSQGTLGLLTEVSFRLIKPKKHSELMVIFLKDFKQLAEIVLHVLKHKPESFESYDDKTLKLAIRFAPQLMRVIGAKNWLRLGLAFLPEVSIILRHGFPKLVLMAEFTGETPAEVFKKMEIAKNDLAEFNVPIRLTKTEDEAKQYWVIRHESFNLLRKHVKRKHTAPFIDDLVVLPSQLPEFLPRLNAIMAQYKIEYTIAGHIGDANFHIIPLMDFTLPETKQIIAELEDKILELVFEFKGSMTGEHNDGLIRGPYLKEMFGEQVYALFEETKRIFDPAGIFNPGKKVGGSLRYALEHIKNK